MSINDMTRILTVFVYNFSSENDNGTHLIGEAKSLIYEDGLIFDQKAQLKIVKMIYVHDEAQ